VEFVAVLRGRAARLAKAVGSESALDVVLAVVESAVAMVPECVGVSLTLLWAGVPFTVAASSTEIAALDGVQYADQGPCVDAASAGTALGIEDMVTEAHWQLFSRASAAAGVHSSLSLPLVAAGRTIGAVNLYGGTPHAFDGKSPALGRLVSERADLGVANTDLSFLNREITEQPPPVIVVEVEQAIGVLMFKRNWPADISRERLRQAASQAECSVEALARALLHLTPDRL
jgi:transcriptional regulator with GAF, ATPase, and Fis domain